MLLWKEELLKMNQQQPNPGSVGGGRGCELHISKVLGCGLRSLGAGAAGTPVFGFLSDSKGLPHPLEPSTWNLVTLHHGTESRAPARALKTEEGPRKGGLV